MRRILLALVLAGVSGPALAQSPAQNGEMRSGIFSVRPALVFSIGHDTNPYRESPADPDVETYVIPQVEGSFRPGHLRTDFFGAIEMVTFANRVGARNHQIGTRNEWRGGRLTPFLDFTSKHTNANPVGFEVGRKSMRNENALKTGLRTDFTSRLSGSAFYVRTATSWDADALYQTSSLREKLNRVDTSIGGTVSLALTPLTSVRFSGEHSSSEFVFSPGRNGSGARFGPGLTITGPAAITGNVDLGIRSFTSTTSNVKFQGLYGSAVATRAFPTETIVSVRWDRDMQFSYDLSLAYFVSRALQLTVIQPLNSSLAVQGYVVQSKLLYDKALPAETPLNAVNEAGFAIGQRIGRVIRVGVLSEWAQANGNQPWSELRVVAFLTYGAGSFQRLDRPVPFQR